MSINNINNLPTFPNTVNRADSNAIAGEQSVSDLAKGNIDWFSSADMGKTTPISAQGKFGPDASLDDMVKDIMGHLGLA